MPYAYLSVLVLAVVLFCTLALFIWQRRRQQVIRLEFLKALSAAACEYERLSSSERSSSNALPRALEVRTALRLGLAHAASMGLECHPVVQDIRARTFTLPSHPSIGAPS